MVLPATAERPTLRPRHAWGPLLNTTSPPRVDDDSFESLWRDGGRPRRMAQLVLWILEENEVTGDRECAFRKVLGEPDCGDWGVLGHPCCGRLGTALRLRVPLLAWLPAPVLWREPGRGGVPGRWEQQGPAPARQDAGPLVLRVPRNEPAKVRSCEPLHGLDLS